MSCSCCAQGDSISAGGGEVWQSLQVVRATTKEWPVGICPFTLSLASPLGRAKWQSMQYTPVKMWLWTVWVASWI